MARVSLAASRLPDKNLRKAGVVVLQAPADGAAVLFYVWHEFVAVPGPWGGRDRRVQVYSHLAKKVHLSDGMGRDGMGWDRESLTLVCMTSCSVVIFCVSVIRCTLVRSGLPKDALPFFMSFESSILFIRSDTDYSVSVKGTLSTM